MLELQNLLLKEKSKVEKYILSGEYSQALSLLYKATEPFLMLSSEYDLYRDVTPYDNKVFERHCMEYVNASFVTVHDDQYIVCQEPKKEFVERFLSLVERSRANVIIALKDDCTYSDAVQVLSTKTVFLEGSPFLVDEVLKVGGRDVRRIACVAWKDHSVLSRSQFDFLHEYLSQFGSETKVIHCRAGAGRAGTFIMYRALMKRIGQITVNVFVDLLIQLRCQRTLLVQSTSQLKFLVNKFLK